MEALDTWYELVLAVGALGTAAFGIVEGFKWTYIGAIGFGQIERTMGAPLMDALLKAYGRDSRKLLKAQYRDGRSKGSLVRTIRQGVRIGLGPDNAAALAEHVGVVAAGALEQAAEAVASGEPLSDELRGILGRFELAVDARIDAALGLAETYYKGAVRLHASFVAIALALIAAILLADAETGKDVAWARAFIVGIAAVPMAPIAKDVGKALRQAGTALRAGR